MSNIRRIITKPLGELLIERGVIDQAQLDEALELQGEQGGLVGELLIQLGHAKEEQIAQALTTQYGFPYLPLRNYAINAHVAEALPEEVARQYRVVPVDQIRDNLTIAISNPLNEEAIKKIAEITGCHVHVFVSTSSDIDDAIDECYGPDSETG